MSDSASAGAGEEQEVIVDLKEVRDRELNEVVLRRERAFRRRNGERGVDSGDNTEKSVIRRSLIGLALSGGGLRSAAFSLGILQGLHKYGVLPFIDYLSTVSGGGYAGAYLSSAALHPQSTNEDGTESEFLFPIADDNGKQSPRMLKFINGGSYLRKTGVFINRYLVGLFLIWLVVLSGLMAAASLVTYFYRMLDHPTSINWTTALGFQGDLRRALFPAFVLFVLWGMCWGISYFKFGRHATGRVARFFFYLLVASLLVALAALLGTGDISLSGGSSDSFSGTFKTLIFGTIAASLLPYLTPQRLIRSGTNPKHVGERYIFWLTTRALAYGVPFVFVAFFARENISNFNDYRDDRLVRSDIKNWGPTSPMWSPLVNSQVWVPLSDSKLSAPVVREPGEKIEHELKPGNIWAGASDAVLPLMADKSNDSTTADKLKQLPQVGAVFTKIFEYSSPPPDAAGTETEAANSDSETRSESGIPERLANLSLRQLESLHNQLTPILAQVRESGVTVDHQDKQWVEIADVLQLMVDIQIQQRLGNLLTASEVDSDKIDKSPDGEPDENVEFKRPREYAEISFLNRWWHFFAYVGEQIMGDDAAASENLFGEMVAAKSASRAASNRTVQAINRELVRPDFYKTFLPSEIFAEQAVTEGTMTAKYTKKNEGVKLPADARFEGFKEFDLNGDASQTQELTIAEKVTQDTVSPLVAAEFARLRESHPGSSAEEWLAALRTLRKQAEENERTSLLKAETPENALEAAVVADAQRGANYSINHQILHAYYGNAIGDDRSKVFASVVLVEDQRTRWNWFVGSSIVFLIASALVDLNATSWHGFYSTRIASMWIEKTPGLVNGTPMAQLETTKVGRPYHLLTGAVHTGSVHDGAEYTTKRDRFLFSKLHCGSEATGYIETSRYMDGEYTLEDAVAISGAAVSPIQTDNPLIVGLLFLANIRLGQWVPNPSHDSQLPKSIQRILLSAPFTPLRFLYNRLLRFLYNKRLSVKKPSFCFVTDGGHYENLGVEALLKRRCRLIIAADAGQDSDSVFADLTRLIRNTKRDDGITFAPMGVKEMPLALKNLVPDPETRLAREHFLVVKIRYPADPEDRDAIRFGHLVYLKPTLTGDEPFELRQFHQTQENFPHDPTSDQFYDADRFDSYRALGLHIASELCKSMAEGDGVQLAEADSSLKFIDQFIGDFHVASSGEETFTESDEERSVARVRGILAELRSSDAAKHERARQKLERLGVASFVAMADLLRAFLDEHWSVKLCIQRLLYDHPREALPRLVDVIENADDLELQIAAADVIWEYGSGPYVLDLSSSIAPLARLSAERQVAARVAAARALAVIGKKNPAAQEALKRCKADRSQKVRNACSLREK